MSSFDQRAELTITAICNPTNIGRLEQDAQEELDRLLHEGVTNDELARAKQGHLQDRKVARASDTALAAILSDLRRMGRTMDYEAELEKKIEGLHQNK